MKIKEIQTLLEKQPSVSGNTYFVGTIYILSWILAVGFFILSIGLLLEGWFGFKIFLDWVSKQLELILNEDQRKNISTSFGLISFVLSAIFFGVIFLSRMILNRNHFIIEIEDWIYENIPELLGKYRRKKVNK